MVNSDLSYNNKGMDKYAVEYLNHDLIIKIQIANNPSNGI